MAAEGESKEGPEKAQKFPETHWSMITRLQGDDSERKLALDVLCSRYWYPIYSYCRGTGLGPIDAEDVTQGFFLRLLGKNGFELAMPAKGKLRTFLLKDLQFYRLELWEKETAKKRGGPDRKLISIDQGWAEDQLIDSLQQSTAPDTIFDQEWAVNLVRSAARTVEQEFTVSGKADVFHALKPLVTPTGSGADYEAIRSALGWSTEKMKATVFRTRKKMREALESVVLETVVDPSEAEEELRYLREVLS